jgi:hypothetical protein
MKKLILSFTLLSIVFTSCKKEQSPFEVSKQHIGLLTDSTQVKDLKSIFSNDSVANLTDNNQFTGTTNSIEVFDKTGKKLLVLSPKQASDAASTIKSVQIIDSKYKTEKNISNISTFKDITNAYSISRIDNLINSIVVTVKELNASFTISKEELPASLRFDMNAKIEAISIPDNAKIKYFFINWNN